MSTDTTKFEEARQNNIAKIGEVTQQIAQLDATEGAKANELLALYGALHADPSGNAKDKEGRTAAEVYAAYVAKSKEVAIKRIELENQLNELNKGVARIADNDTLRQAAKERAAASAAACQEPFKDNSEFANPELDKIRSGLQKAPLPGGDTASIDDGTGGVEVTQKQ